MIGASADRHGLVACLVAGLLSACISGQESAPDPPTELRVGESRDVVLLSMRFDVQGVEQVVTREDILALPDATQRGLWLYDLDLTGRSGTPRLMDNAMAQIRSLAPDDPTLSQAERNMVRLLNMTPDTADLRGTALEELLSIAPKVGFSAAEILAKAAGIGVEDPFLPDRAVTQAILDGVIGTHPAAQFRPGPKTADNPSGLVPVPRGHIPVTLADVASDLRTLSSVFGPRTEAGAFHPGFILGASEGQILGTDFQMIMKATANALPFKGLDLTRAEVGSVSSLGLDSTRLFDFSDPDWLRLEGLGDKKKIVRKLTFQILEHPAFLPPGASPLPRPWGSSPVWTAPRWTLERVVAEAGLASFGGLTFGDEWFLGDDLDPLFSLEIEEGWMTMATKGGVGSPPAPLYLWDLMTEVAQARLHDGPDPDDPDARPIPEGEAHVRFTLEDVEIGVTTDQITEAIRRNLEADPTALVETAGVLLDQNVGASDFFYFLPRPDSPPADQGDWLYFIHPDDMGPGEQRDYPRPGFFRDAALSDKASDTRSVEGDVVHEKVRIAPGMKLFIEDDEGRLYQLDVLDKPSPRRIAIRVTRLS